jgi:hypothetical protein
MVGAMGARAEVPSGDPTVSDLRGSLVSGNYAFIDAEYAAARATPIGRICRCRGRQELVNLLCK